MIQPQVPLRLPCYDFTLVADPTVVGCFQKVSAPPSGKTNSHGVTGGVYKARERIHRHALELQSTIRTETVFGDLLKVAQLLPVVTAIVARV